MNFVKKMFGYSNETSNPFPSMEYSELDTFSGQATIYRVEANSQRIILIRNAGLKFVKPNNVKYQYAISVKDKNSKDLQYEFPIGLNMSFENYYYREEEPIKKDFMGFVWEVDKETKINVEFSSENHGLVDAVIFKEITCKLIYETIHQKPFTQANSEQDYLRYSNPVVYPFAVKEKEAHVKVQYPSLEEYKEEKNNPAMEFLALSKLMTSISHEKGVLLCNSGGFYLMDKNDNFQLINKSVLLVIRDNSNFNYTLEVYSSDRTLIHSKNINSELSYHIDSDKNMLKWISCSPAGLDLLAIQFDAFNLSKTIQFLLNKCCFEVNKKEFLQDVVQKKEDVVIVDNYFAQDREKMEIEEEILKNEFEEEEEEIVFQDENGYKSFFQPKEPFKKLAQGKAIRDRAFAIKGEVVSIYKTGEDKEDVIEHIIDCPEIFSTDKKKVIPNKMLLHEQDTKIILLAADDQQRVFYYDLEKGKVVQELQADEFNRITEISPESKEAIFTNNPVFIAINDRNIFKIDPRVNKPKESAVSKKVYSKTNNFQAIASTSNGHFAIGNKEGEIRLFKEVGKNARNQYHGLGDPILFLDCTKDGRFLIATCKNYLIFLRTFAEGKNGFVDQLKNEEKGTPRVIKLHPKTFVQYGLNEITFVQAKFDERENEKEKYIVANTKELIITWTLKNVMEGKVLKYEVKRIEEGVVAGEFKYNTEDKVLLLKEKELGLQKIKKNKVVFKKE